MRLPFNSLFQVVNGAIAPRVAVQINGVTLGPGVTFGRGVYFGGLDPVALVNRDLEVEQTAGVYVVKGYYP
jgi:hypothetical protein